MTLKVVLAILALLVTVETSWIALENKKLSELSSLIAELRGLVAKEPGAPAQSDQAVVSELKREWNERKTAEAKAVADAKAHAEESAKGLYDFANNPNATNILRTDESYLVHDPAEDASPTPTPKKDK